MSAWGEDDTRDGSVGEDEADREVDDEHDGEEIAGRVGRLLSDEVIVEC